MNDGNMHRPAAIYYPGRGRGILDPPQVLLTVIFNSAWQNFNILCKLKWIKIWISIKVLRLVLTERSFAETQVGTIAAKEMSALRLLTNLPASLTSCIITCQCLMIVTFLLITSNFSMSIEYNAFICDPAQQEIFNQFTCQRKLFSQQEIRLCCKISFVFYVVSSAVSTSPYSQTTILSDLHLHVCLTY